MNVHPSITVQFAYPVISTRGIFREDNRVLFDAMGSGSVPLIAFVDDGLLAHWPNLIEDIERWCRSHVDLVTSVQTVPGGEGIKNDLDILDRFGRLARRFNLCRHSYVLIVGGGAVLDAVGFAASLTHRGLYQVRVPTTVLSQADSGVGVKNGMNRFGVKNYYGTFTPPAAVINDTEFLGTLSRRDWLSGIAEAVKVGAIKDRDFLDFLDENIEGLVERDLETMERTVAWCARLHIDHITTCGDPFETGSARPLDFGHWSAHRLESMTDNGLRHGEAVAVGIALDLHAAVDLGLITANACEYVCSILDRSGLALWHPALESRSESGELEVLVGIQEFREHLGGELTVAMPKGLGDKVDIHDLPEDLVIRSIEALKERNDRCAGKEPTSPTA